MAEVGKLVHSASLVALNTHLPIPAHVPDLLLHIWQSLSEEPFVILQLL